MVCSPVSCPFPHLWRVPHRLPSHLPGIHLRSACACAGVDTEVYTQEWFDTDYQVMLWDVAFEMLLGAGRDLLAMPPLTKETPFRTLDS